MLLVHHADHLLPLYLQCCTGGNSGDSRQAQPTHSRQRLLSNEVADGEKSDCGAGHQAPGFGSYPRLQSAYSGWRRDGILDRRQQPSTAMFNPRGGSCSAAYLPATGARHRPVHRHGVQAAISTTTASWIRPGAAWHLAGHEDVEPQLTSRSRITAVGPGEWGASTIRYAVSLHRLSWADRWPIGGPQAEDKLGYARYLPCRRSKSHTVDIGAAPRVVEVFIRKVDQ
jgi:hypothetical protein